MNWWLEIASLMVFSFIYRNLMTGMTEGTMTNTEIAMIDTGLGMLLMSVSLNDIV